MKSFMGIDPGVSGGIAIVSEDRKHVRAWTMPKTREGLIDIFRTQTRDVEVVYVEKVWSSPQMGVASAFTFGGKYEGPILVAMCAGIEVIEVLPQKWQRTLGLGSDPSKAKRRKKGDPELTPEEKKLNRQIHSEEQAKHKRDLFDAACLWFPNFEMTLSRCDALLIAEYARRIHCGLIAAPAKQEAVAV